MCIVYTMEEEERHFIRKNQRELIDLICCSETLLAHLQAEDILGPADLADIRSLSNTTEKTNRLLELVQTKSSSAFHKFKLILRKENQSGAAKLLEAFGRPPSSPSFDDIDTIFKELPESLKSIISNSSSTPKKIILLSHDINLSVKRIENVIGKDQIHFTSDIEYVLNNEISFKDLLKIEISGCCRYGLHKNWKLLICSIENEAKISPLQKENWETAKDVIMWSDFNEHGRSVLFEKVLRFQGDLLTLNKLCQKTTILTGQDKSRVELLGKLETWFLIRLYNDHQPDIADGNIPNVPEHYIFRHMLSRTHISRKVLNATKNPDCNDVFVFKCKNLRPYDLHSFVEKYGDGRCDTSGSQIKKPILSRSSILLDTLEDYDEICKRAVNVSGQPKSVHLLECICNPENKDEIIALQWLESSGSVATLQRYIHQTQTSFNETDLYSSTTATSIMPVCISDKPGMGKSCLLSNCAKELQKRSKETGTKLYVQYVRMNEFVARLMETMTLQNCRFQYITSSIVLKAFIKSCSSSKAGRKLIKSTLRSTSIEKIKEAYNGQMKFEVLFDGMEELSSEMFEMALCAVRIFNRHDFPFDVRIWVTTRPHLLCRIEECLGTLGHTIQPLDETDQANLLTKHWLGSGEELDEGKIYGIAEHCLYKLKEKLSLCEDGDNIAGIPFLCFLIAKVYKKDARLIYQENQTKQFDRRITDLTITRIYEQYIEDRLRKCNVATDRQENLLYSSHIELAIQILFPEGFKAFSKLKTSNREQLLSPGLLQANNSEEPLKFVHITFAAYFAAQKVLLLFQDVSSLSVDLAKKDHRVALFVNLLDEAFSVENVQFTVSNVMPYAINAFKFRHYHICYFLNFSATSEFDLSNTVNTLISFYSGDVLKLADVVWNWLLAAASANYFKIASSLINTLKILLKSCNCLPDNQMFFNLLLLTAKYGNEELMEKVCNFSKELTNIPISDYVETCEPVTKTFQRNPAETLTPLHVAIEAGNFKVFHFLLTSEKIMTDIKKPTYRYLLHWCLQSSLNDKMAVVNRKKEILNFIADKIPYFLTKNPMSKEIVLERMHIELLLTYMTVKTAKDREKGLIPEKIIKDSHGDNFLHLLASGHYDESINADTYHNTVIRLHEMKIPFGLAKYLEDRNFFDWRAVDITINSLELLDDTLEFFKSIKITYNVTDFRGSTPFFKAVAGQRQERFLQKLVDHGATWKAKISNVTVLHVAAAFFNYSAVKFCIKSKRLEQKVNVQDKDGNTPLHMCFRLEDMILILESQAHDWAGTEDWRNTSFAQVRSSILPVSRRFRRSSLSEGSDSCSFPSEGLQRSYISKAAQIEHEPSNQHKVISFLIKHGAEISQANKMGITPMHLALDICLGGLSEEEERESLEDAKERLFLDAKYMTLALKGLLLNAELGYLWHPSLLFSFADQIIKHGGDINLRDNEDGSSLLHLASKAHSLFGIKYLIEVAKFSVNILNKNGQTPLNYMDCTAECKIYNHLAIREYLLSKVDAEM